MALLFIFVFAALLGLASQAGWTVDSRDSADWAPSDDGARATHTPCGS
jgi:hypothetical protein